MVVAGDLQVGGAPLSHFAEAGDREPDPAGERLRRLPELDGPLPGRGRVRVQQQHPQPQRCVPCPLRDGAQQQRVVEAEQAEPPDGEHVDHGGLLDAPLTRTVCPGRTRAQSRTAWSSPAARGEALPVRPPRPRMPGVPRNPVTGQARPSSRAASWSHTA